MAFSATELNAQVDLYDQNDNSKQFISNYVHVVNISLFVSFVGT